MCQMSYNPLSPDDHHSFLQLPSPIITRRTRTNSTCEIAKNNPEVKGKIKYFCRQKGHGFIAPDEGSPDLFVHISESRAWEFLFKIKFIVLLESRVWEKVLTPTLISVIPFGKHYIEGEYVPLKGDEVTYRLCPIPPKREKFQATHVKIINFTPEVHQRWDCPPNE
ncbi:Cold shock domain-containing protein [Armadillidium nasatum]|uniref:Cold shock domain-containing protein n=1 Tax=Armadillidium nasatum TaxID=96803 RepID=A0A5N5SXL1_9CRUS|nr:Cold shock domain-containing protein [Armadillidium nasatum]